MSLVKRISANNPIQGIDITLNKDVPHGYPISFTEKFTFPKEKEIEIDQRFSKNEISDKEAVEQIVFIFQDLLFELISYDVLIIPCKMKKRSKYIVEAFFTPKNSKQKFNSIHIPFPIFNDEKLLNYLSLNKSFKMDILNYYFLKLKEAISLKDILRLLIVTAHEYGHFKSYLLGNHDDRLRKGIYYYHNKIWNFEYVRLVYTEEVIAWKQAYYFLIKNNFYFFEYFNEVKKESLKAYFDELNLMNANVNTYMKLSFLGDDFYNYCKA